MDHAAPPTDPGPAKLLRSWGFWGLLTGAVALALVFVQVAGPALNPSPSAATQIGEMAGEIRRAAWRSFLGLPTPEAEIQSPSFFDYLAIVGPVLGIIAIVLSVISGALKENWKFTVYGISLGGLAVVFQYLWWLALLIGGIILLVSIIANIGEIFGG